jgi:hypothetical protein
MGSSCRLSTLINPNEGAINMDISSKFDAWKNTVQGLGLDIDKAYGRQCVDPVLNWGQVLFPGIHYSMLFPPVLSAKDMFDRANIQFFDKIVNDHANVNQLPQKGDIAIFAASPEPGYSSTYQNPDGTILVVDHADPNYVLGVHQDSAEANPVCRLKQRAWRYTRCIGWLRPKVLAQIPQTAVMTGPAPGAVQDPRIGRNVWLKPPTTTKDWSAYRVGQFPDRAKRIGALRPDWFNNGPNGQKGIVYPILGVSPNYANVVTVKSDTYGLIDIYLDGDAVIL